VKVLSPGEIIQVPLIFFGLLLKSYAPICFLMIQESDKPDQVFKQVPEIKKQAKQLLLLLPVDELMVSGCLIIPNLIRMIKNAQRKEGDRQIPPAERR